MVDSILHQTLHFFIMLRLYYFKKTDRQSVNTIGMNCLKLFVPTAIEKAFFPSIENIHICFIV
jgi:hypothetical protein